MDPINESILFVLLQMNDMNDRNLTDEELSNTKLTHISADGDVTLDVPLTAMQKLMHPRPVRLFVPGHNEPQTPIEDDTQNPE
jgi:hypothetical protein